MSSKVPTTHKVKRGNDLSLHFEGEGYALLIQGTASTFCAPWFRNVPYVFKRQGIPVSCHSDCVIEVGPITSSPATNPSFDDKGGHKSNNNPSSSCASITASIKPTDTSFRELHAILQPQRFSALLSSNAGGSSSAGGGPVVLVVGEVDTGKSSLCKALINLAVVEGLSNNNKNKGDSKTDDVEAQQPTTAAATANNFGICYLDVDVGQTGLSCPGTLSAGFMENPVSIDDPFTNVMPLSFFLGATSIASDTLTGRYLDICAHMKLCVDSVRNSNSKFFAGGVIINTMGWTNSYGYEALVHMIDIFKVTHIIVTGSDAPLAKKLQVEECERNRSNRNISVLEYRKNGAVFSRSAAVRRQARSGLILKYFMGSDRMPLQPSRVVMPLAGLVFVDAVSFEPMSTEAVVPNNNTASSPGFQAKSSSSKPVAVVQPLSLCAVSHARSIDEIPFANVAGFVLLLEIGKLSVTLLSPSPGPLPNGILLVGQGIGLTEREVPPLL